MDHKGATEHPAASPSFGGSSRGDGSKRPAGRTKFQETRHPVFRGVRRRGRAGRWVCEVRVPGSRGDRLWVGTFDTAEAAARAHDAAMLALCGGSFAGLNFADSAWLLHVPRATGGTQLPDVQRAATEAVAEFMRRQGGNNRPAAASSSAPRYAAASPASTLNNHETALDSGMHELDMYGGMDAGSYYASLAEGLLMEPPPSAVECPEDEECGAAGMELWS